MKILLTDGEIEQIHLGDENEEDDYYYEHRLNKAQLKKVMNAGYISSSGEFILPREITKEIMQALLNEVNT